MQQITDVISSVMTVLHTFRFVDFLDILIVAILFYALLTMVHGTRAAQLFKGIILLVVANAVASYLQMRVLGTVLSAILQIGVLALIVIFQPEIRRALEQIGYGKIALPNFLHTRTDAEELFARTQSAIAAVCDAARQMSDSKTGALIVFERKSHLKEVVQDRGTLLNADVTVGLLNTVFYEGTPLHDGATIIREGRITAAGCVLPLNENLELSKEMGTRHRAAVSLSENSDAIVVVVSEERGEISVCKAGVLIRHMNRESLYKILTLDVLSQISLPDKKNAHQSKWQKLTGAVKKILGRQGSKEKENEGEREDKK